MIRVLLVDDQQLVRAGLRMILGPDDGFEVVGECADGSEVLSAVEHRHPDVVLMDVRMKRVDGAEATRQLRQVPDAPPVLVLTTYDDDEVLSRALRAGAAGFQLKDAPTEDILRAVRVVAAGGTSIDPAVAGRVLAAYRAFVPAGPPAQPPEALTPRELEVLQLIGRGLSNEEIAGRLVVTVATVKAHFGRVLDKLSLRDRAAAIVYAFDHGSVRTVPDEAGVRL
jgi:DNA-binding NarL/FixJ family response regulator